jgi:Zn-dependent protease
VVCDRCHTLVHAATLEQLAAGARLYEEEQRYTEARDSWLKALELLPPDSAQAQWIRANTERLNGLAGAAASSARPSWAKKLGPFAPLVLVLAKGKFFVSLFKLKFLFSLGAFVAFYWALYGMKFGIGFALLILVHEMGHFIAIKRRGLPADMPVFLPGLGAYVRWAALGVSVQTRAFVSLAGPLAGCVGSAACALLWMKTGDPLWIGLASLSALLNVLNLIPVWVLDGGQAIAALDKTQRIVVSAAAVLFAALFSQPAFLLVAAGAGYRAFDKNLPPEPSHPATLYYVLLLAALGYLLKLGPLVPPGAT